MSPGTATQIRSLGIRKRVPVVEEQVPPGTPKSERLTRIFLGAAIAAALVYAAAGLTPSSYGGLLEKLGSVDQGPILGTPRPIRADEWALLTPLFQAAVRNNFREVNETSFYRESLRTVFPIPLRNWSLVFRPQMWAFFLTSPATAFSVYFAFLFCASVCGYFLLFQEMRTGPWLAAATSILIFFSAFIQFWGFWTLAGFPWILLVLLRPMAWWKKALVFSWLIPATTLSHPYPPLFVNLGLATLLLLVAVKRSWFRSPGEIAAAAIGGTVTAGVLYLYFAKLIPVMANTVYPAHRVLPAGTVPLPVVLSQVYPFLTLSLSGFDQLTGLNIVENATIGTFLPLLTLCVLRYRRLTRNPAVLLSLLILLAGAGLMTLWQLAPLPGWVGKAFLWNTSPPERLFPATGLLLIFASLLIWSSGLVELRPARIAIFFLAGPVAALWLKRTLYPAGGLASCKHDLAICGLAFAGCLAAIYARPAMRGPVLLTLLAMINLGEIGRFAPLQPARPIFDIPETPVLSQLRAHQESTPGNILIEPNYLGSTLNGLGFRSVAHVLPTPQLAFFRKYFPAMDAAQFNAVFNRYAHIQLSADPLPSSPFYDAVRVPAEVFEPVRNRRTLTLTSFTKSACASTLGGSIEKSTSGPQDLVLEGWAPWRSETATQGIRVMSHRTIRSGTLITIQRPDIGELMSDYNYVKAGFRLQLFSDDGQAIERNDVALIAVDTAQGDVRVGDSLCR